MIVVTGRRVYVNTQRTQTVKICTRANTRGVYEKYYRIDPPYVLPQRQMAALVSQFNALPELEQWLRSDRKAYREQHHEATSTGGRILEENDDDSDFGREEFAEEAVEPEVGGAA